MSDKASNDIVMLMGDDVQVLTQGWDQLIADEFDKYEDKILMVVPSDGRAKGSMKHGNEIKIVARCPVASGTFCCTQELDQHVRISSTAIFLALAC